MQKECHALVWALEYYRPFLEEKKFKVQTHPLKWIMETKETKTKFVNWITFLEKFKTEIVPQNHAK